MAGGVRIGIAWDDVTLEPSPTWSYLTDDANLVAGYTIDRGRQFEFDRTDTGTANVTISDVDGLLDPTNPSSVLYGKIEPLLQIQIELLNPVLGTYFSRYRGFIEAYNYAVDPSQQVTRLEINCVDLFAILTAIEMQPGDFGHTPPAPTATVDYSGNIFFDNGQMDARIDKVVTTDAHIPDEFTVVFTGNVYCQESVYSPSENVLQVVQDAADAEFPTVSNVFCDRFGRLCVHGRLSKFDPVGVSTGAGPTVWDFQQWKAGDGDAVAISPTDTAHVRQFSFERGLSKIFNKALCTPNQIDMTLDDIAAQTKTNDASVEKYGIRSWSAENLLIGAPGGGDILHTAGASILTGNNALDECALYANYIQSNYGEPQNRITSIVFRSTGVTGAAAAANWKFLSRCDISDSVAVTVADPGGGGFNLEPFFIEGIHEEVKPLNSDYADVTLSLDLSPTVYFTSGPWDDQGSVSSGAAKVGGVGHGVHA